MKREDYLRELDAAGRELRVRAKTLSVEMNPVHLMRQSVSRGWKWWLPGASVAGFIAARFFRLPGAGKALRGKSAAAATTGAAYWVPLLLKLVPQMLAQMLPLILSLRSKKNR